MIFFPALHIWATWEHEGLRKLGGFPAPKDQGTREFQLRAFLSRFTRVGWQRRLLQPYRRLVVTAPFTLLPQELAAFTSSFHYSKLDSTNIPLMFPQAALPCMLLQMLGNYHFPTAVNNIQLKRISITHLRPISLAPKEEPEATEELETTSDRENETSTSQDEIKCVMSLIDRNYINEGVEFLVQTDLFDAEGVAWQSTMYLVVPMQHQKGLLPLQLPKNLADEKVVGQCTKPVKSTQLTCSDHDYDEYASVALPGYFRWFENRFTPQVWAAASALAEVEKQALSPDLPVQVHLTFDTDRTVPLNTELPCEIKSNGNSENPIVAFDVADQYVSGYLRRVGWRFNLDAKEISQPTKQTKATKAE